MAVLPEINHRETILNVPYISNLVAAEDYRFQNGKLAFVRELGEMFFLDKSSALIADNEVVINTRSGLGRWVRYKNTQLTQFDWYVNSDTGNDSNTGATSGTALKTLAKLNSILDGMTSESSINVYLAGSFNTDDMRFDVKLTTPFTNVMVTGTPTVIHTGTLTDYAAPVTNVSAAQLTDTLIDWTPYVGKRLRFTDGAAINATCFIMKADPESAGTDVARTTEVILLDETAALPWASLLGTAKTPDDTSAYVIEDLTPVRSIRIDVDNAWGEYAAPPCVVSNVDIVASTGRSNSLVMNTATSVPEIDSSSPCVVKSIVRSPFSGSTTFVAWVGCLIAPSANGGNYKSIWFSRCGYIPFVANQALAAFECLFQGMLLQGGPLSVFNGRVQSVGNLIICDTTNGVQITFSQLYLVAAMWGIGLTGVLGLINSGALLQYTTLPTTGGTAGQCKVNGSIQTWATAAATGFVTASASGVVLRTTA